jgi:hypothetical protein
MVLAHHRSAPLAASAATRSPRQLGGATIEMAFVALPLAMVLLTAIDFGTRASYYNRLRSAAREGAMLAEYTPGMVTGCPVGIDDVEDRILGHEPELAELDGFEYRVVIQSSKVELPRQCLTAGSVPPGTKIAVEVTADHAPISMLTQWVLPPKVTGRAVVVVQG